MKKKLQVINCHIAKAFLLLAFFGLSGMVNGQNHVFKGAENAAFSDIHLSHSSKWSTDRGNVLGEQGFFSMVGDANYVASGTLFIDGYVKLYTTATRQAASFPVGQNGKLRLFSIAQTVPGNATVAVAWIAGNPTDKIDPTDPAGNQKHDIALHGADIVEVVKEGQWDWHVFKGSYVDVKINVAMPDLTSYNYTPDRLRLVGWDGTKWVSLGTPTGTASLTENSFVYGFMKDNITAVSLGFSAPSTYVWTGNTDSDWNKPTNWTGNLVPPTGSDIEISATANNPLVVPGDASNPTIIGNLDNKSDKPLVVPADKTIIVNGTVTGSSTLAEANKIIVKADATKPNGTIIFKGQPCNQPVYGTVQMYARGFKGASETWTDDIPGSPTFNQTFTTSYHWQYFGVPVESASAQASFYGSFLREYDETFNGNSNNQYYDKWHPLNNNSVLTAFKGYEITQDQATTYYMKGKLQFCDKNITMTRKAPAVTGSTDSNVANKHYGLGQNVFGNSYTAAINVDDMIFPTEVENVVYLYNTGRFFDWANHVFPSDQENSGARLAGQYTAIPKNVASAIYDGRIPSMNGFLLRFTQPETVFNGADATVTLKYANGGVKPNTKPQTVAKEPLSYLDIILSSKSTVDKVVLVSQKGTSENFDNGWDGYKFFGTPTAFIYSETPDGPMQVNTTENLYNKLISFYANKDKNYTLHLVKHNLVDYKELSLLDLETRQLTPLTADTTLYHFTAKEGSKVARRFKIVNGKDFDFANDDLNISYQNGKVIATNYTKKKGTLEVYDVAGRLVMSKAMNIGVNSYSTNLPQGGYIVRAFADGKQSKLKVLVK